jgi:hypothetical protein
MAGYNATEALDLIMESSFEELDSGGEEDIDEDPAFPLQVRSLKCQETPTLKVIFC